MTDPKPKCRVCKKEPMGDPEPCPFAQKIDDEIEMCTCCDKCRAECAKEI